ncbi:MAG: hypothetical protein NTY90_02380 [Candidatus Micrarchaeota archaeon]|nr:hypothetical protein [Candidatus Micrarchaeota archaeon]
MKTGIRVDLKKLSKEKKRNFLERLAFIDAYVAWLKKTPNKKWSRQQKTVVDQAIS